MFLPLSRGIRTRSLIGGLACAAIALAPASRSQEIPSFARDVPRIQSGEPIFRFNGANLTGFYSYLRGHKYDDPAKVFTIQNGMIRISGEEFGGLATKDEFHDYHLVAEWKWGEQTFGTRKNNARDSGILLHCVGPDGAAGGAAGGALACGALVCGEISGGGVRYGLCRRDQFLRRVP